MYNLDRAALMKNNNYLLNCFLLILPLIVWNVLLIDYLPKSYGPEIFDKNIPTIIRFGEAILRPILFGLPLFMILSLKMCVQRIGFFIYSLGLLFYFASWIVLILYPESSWSTSAVGFMAPAYTTLLFFIGIGLIGRKAFFNFPAISIVYILLSLLFVAAHVAHAYVVFLRL